MLQRAENSPGWSQMGNCMKITKLKHELHGIQAVDSGAVLPRPHHLNFDQFSAIGHPLWRRNQPRGWLLPVDEQFERSTRFNLVRWDRRCICELGDDCRLVPR